jgi:hypothetical protein
MNVNYVQYDIQTGQIFGTGSSDEPSVKGVSGYLIVDQQVDNTKYKVENNVLVPLPAKPGYYYYYNYITNQWVFDEQSCANAVIAERNQLLYASDWTQIPNNPLTPALQEQWAIYRQALRDIPSQQGYPAIVNWPTPPQG